MLTYDPSVSSLINEIPEQQEMPLNEEIAREALSRDPQAATKMVPTGLLKNYPPEKNVDESQMAEFATSIDEIMPGPSQMIQDEMMGPPSMPMKGNVKTERRSTKAGESTKNPFGLTDEQFYAAIAGLAAIVAFSKPVQGRLSTMVPKFFAEGTSDPSLTGLLASAVVAAIVFYFARQVLTETK